MTPSIVYDFHKHRIGDTIGAAYCLDVHHLLTAGKDAIGIINRGAIDICRWFPWLADHAVAEPPPEWADVPRYPLGNIWITAPTVKQAHGVPPRMAVPLDDSHWDVALHCLEDADYNTGRNHTPAQFDELERWLNWHGKKVYRVPSRDGPLPATVDDILAEIGRAKIYIGGDTGFSHAFAAMHPDRPLIAIYGDDWSDAVGFEEERARMNCPHRWCSDPLSFRLYKRIMTDHRFDERQVKALLEKLLQLPPP